MPLFYYARQSQLATKAGIKIWHLKFKKSGKSGGYAVAGGKYCREVLTDAG